MRELHLNIAVKTTLTTCLVVALTLTVTGGWLLDNLRRSTREEAQVQGVLLARTLAASFAVPLARGEHELIQRQVDQIAELPALYPQIVRVVVTDQNGVVVAHTDPTRFNQPWLDSAPEESVTFLSDPTGQTPLLLVEVPVETTLRFGTVEVALSVAASFETGRRSSQRVLAGLVATVVVLSATLTGLMYTRVVRPLRRLASAVEAWKGGRQGLGLRRGPAEVISVARSFDALGARLHQQTVELEQRVEERTRALSEAYEQIRASNEHLERLASTDALTGLANRRAFSERLTSELARARRNGEPLSLVLFDLDHFKRLNDTLGHLEGDEALARIASLLKEEGRRATDFAARWGGEEFTLLLPSTPHVDALLVAERVRAHTEAAGLPGQLTLSGGVATWPEDGSDERTLIAAADDALYAAKQAGRNRIVSSSVRAPGERAADNAALAEGA